MARSSPGGLPRGAWGPEAIISLARRTVGMVDAVFYAPGIPEDKLTNARRVHEAHLPEAEQVLVLYDNTLFGSAEDGFLITPDRLCWKNFWEHPRQIPWGDIDPATIKPESGQVGVAGGHVLMSADVVAGAAMFLTAMASRVDPTETSPYRSGSLVDIAVDAPISTTRVVALSRAQVGEVDGLYFYPSIPPAKLANARATHALHLPEDEVVAVLFDDTVFGGAKDGFLLTKRRLYWKNFTAHAQSISWGEIDADEIAPGKGCVRVMTGEIQVSARSELLAPLSKLFTQIALETQGKR